MSDTCQPIRTCLIRSSRHLISIFMTSLTPHYRGRGGGGELAPVPLFDRRFFPLSLCSPVPLFGCPFVRPSLCSAARPCCSGIPLFSMTHLSGILLFSMAHLS